MDDKKLSYLVAEKYGGISRDEVDAELKRARIEAKFGAAKGFVEILTVVALIVRLAIVAEKAWKTTEDLIIALKAEVASADKINEKRRQKVFNLFAEELDL